MLHRPLDENRVSDVCPAPTAVVLLRSVPAPGPVHQCAFMIEATGGVRPVEGLDTKERCR
jgi:hypothetical protein